MRGIRPIAIAVVGLAALLCFQNCAPNQNYDLTQTAVDKTASGGDGYDGTGDTEPTPAPEPTPVAAAPTPTPSLPVTGMQLTGNYCPFPSANLPKVEIKYFDLQGQDFATLKSVGTRIAEGAAFPDLNVYTENLRFGSINVADALKVAPGLPVTKDNGDPLLSNFAIEYKTHVMIPSGGVDGNYQLGVIASGAVSVEYRPAGGAWTLISERKDGFQDVNMNCSSLLPMKITDQTEIRIRQVQTDRADLQLRLMMRKTDSMVHASCSLTGALFDGLAFKSSILTSLSSAGWIDLDSKNLARVRDASTNLVANGSFEQGHSAFTWFAGPMGTGNVLQGWAKGAGSGGKFELHQTGMQQMTAPDGITALEIDADGDATPDDVYQVIPVANDRAYRFLSQIARRYDRDTLDSNLIEIYVGNRNGASANFNMQMLDSVAGPGNKVWSGYSYVVKPTNNQIMIRFAEPSPATVNDSLGSMLDNVVVREILDSRAVCATTP